MDRQLALVIRRDRSGIPPDPLAARARGNHRLPHSDGLSAGGEEQKKGTFTSACGLRARAGGEQSRKRNARKELPHRSA
jgi:hypothetical protein